MKKILSLMLVAGMAMTAMAVPAKRGGIIRTAADGTEQMVYLHGDETFHYITDAEGNWLDESTLQPMPAEQKAARAKAEGARAKVRRAKAQTQAGSTRNLAPRGLIILVSFSDKAFATPYETIQDMINGDNFTRNYSYDYTYYGQTYHVSVQSSGSAKQYFHDQSWGQYNPQFDIVGPVTVSNKVSYYGKNDSNGDDQNVDAMIREAVKAVDNEVDFAIYDNDNDGKVDFVYFIYAGYGEADGGAATTIWPHNYSYQYYVQYGAEQLTVDGKKIDNYACSNEIQYYGNVYNGIGTFCHEFSHVLGLPDLYATNNATHHTLLDWDILDAGPYNNDGNTPPAYSAYERFFMGWLTPRVLTDPENTTLRPLNDSHEALLMCSGDQHNLDGLDPNPKTFYLIENRPQTGWDKYLPGKGMLLTKITYNQSKWDGNTVNNTASSMGVDMIEAKSNTTSGNNAEAKSTDAFPAGAKQYVGFADHEITNIALTNNVITFLYRGGWPEGVEEVEATKEAAHKIIRDGKIYIIRGDKMFDLTGRVVNE